MTVALSGETHPVGGLDSEKGIDVSASDSTPGTEAKDENSGRENGPQNEATQELERWNESKTNIFRYLVTLYMFIAMGMSDAAYGVSSCVLFRKPVSC